MQQYLNRSAEETSGAREAAIVVIAFLAYTVLRVVVEGSYQRAAANAELVLDLERALGIDIEQDLQSWTLQNEALVRFWNAIYSYAFWPLVLGALVLLWRQDRVRYLLLRDALIVSAVIGLVCFAFFPVSPPRFMPGYVDTIDAFGDRQIGERAGWTNRYAAVPSFHVGWPLLAGIVVAQRIKPAMTAAAVAVIPALVIAMSTFTTGNHWILDAVAGAAVVVVSLRIAERRVPRPGVEAGLAS